MYLQVFFFNFNALLKVEENTRRTYFLLLKITSLWDHPQKTTPRWWWWFKCRYLGRISGPEEREEETGKKDIQEDAVESQPPARQAGGEGPLVHLSLTPLRLSLQWLFCAGNKPATCRTCHCMQKSSTAREGVGIATEAQPRWGQARRSFSHAAFQAKGHQCFHKCPLQTACSLGNKKKWNIKVSMWWLEPLNKHHGICWLEPLSKLLP